MTSVRHQLHVAFWGRVEVTSQSEKSVELELESPILHAAGDMDAIGDTWHQRLQRTLCSQAGAGPDEGQSLTGLRHSIFSC